jgi:hypothetical protein
MVALEGEALELLLEAGYVVEARAQVGRYVTRDGLRVEIEHV